MQSLKIITLSLPLRMGTVNCYLVRTESGFVLIDTGSSNRRAELQKALDGAGCVPGSLKLIVLTHGDFDHTGNAAFLRARYGGRIAMHRDDAGMAERGDMFWNRSSGSAVLRLVAPLLFGFSQSKRFRPDLHLADGDRLTEHGLDATVLSLPGHSKGSIGILAAGGALAPAPGQVLFCGDLLENITKPASGSIVDDPAACGASLEKLQALGIGTVYPGHGRPFALSEIKPGPGPS